MKVGIVTFQETNNYGAILQNYALQQAIKHLGSEVETIDYKSKFIGRPYALAHLKAKGLFSYLFGVAGYICYLPRTKNSRRFREHISYSRSVKRDDLSSLNEEYDAFITGSDQVWNYKLTGSDTTYLLDFVEDKKRCNSYAASLGLSEIDSEKQTLYRELLNNYNYISVREKSAVDVLTPIVGRGVIPVSDPCLLLSPDEWGKVIRKPSVNKPYILVYQLGLSSDAVALAKRIAKREGLKIVFIPFPIGKPVRGKWVMTAGPAELLGYLNNAEYVITDSFHGTLFSILFNKQFFTKLSGTHAGIGSRIYDLLDRYNLLDRLVSDDSDFTGKVDFSNVNELIQTDRKHSCEVLKNICTLAE